MNPALPSSLIDWRIQDLVNTFKNNTILIGHCLYLSFFILPTSTFTDSFPTSLQNIHNFFFKFWHIRKSRHWLNIEMWAHYNWKANSKIWHHSYTIVAVVDTLHVLTEVHREMNSTLLVKFFYVKTVLVWLPAPSAIWGHTSPPPSCVGTPRLTCPCCLEWEGQQS